MATTDSAAHVASTFLSYSHKNQGLVHELRAGSAVLPSRCPVRVQPGDDPRSCL
jgi:hypothetical protein